ncbi:MAG: hypothetical protein HYY96_17740 [Candidatus Tectomicrobia bacterium]|nr:hypothetical protein [Candidatus Tectomicrobia bacterium]
MNRWLPEVQQVQKLVQFAVRDLNAAIQENDAEAKAEGRQPPHLQGVSRRRLRDVERLVEELSREYERQLRGSEERIASLQRELEAARGEKPAAGEAAPPASRQAGPPNAAPPQDGVEDLRAGLLRLEIEVAAERERSAEFEAQIEVERRTHAEELRLAQEQGNPAGAGSEEISALHREYEALGSRFRDLQREHHRLLEAERRREQRQAEAAGDPASGPVNGAQLDAPAPRQVLTTAQEERRLILEQFEDSTFPAEAGTVAAAPHAPTVAVGSIARALGHQEPSRNSHADQARRLSSHTAPGEAEEAELSQRLSYWRDRFASLRRNAQEKEHHLLAELQQQENVNGHLRRQLEAKSAAQARLGELEMARHASVLAALEAWVAPANT